jgi:hypothetical protein
MSSRCPVTEFETRVKSRLHRIDHDVCHSLGKVHGAALYMESMLRMSSIQELGAHQLEHAEDAFHEALKHNEVTGKLQRLRLLTAIGYACNGLRREFNKLKATNTDLEDRIRHMQEYPEECCLEPILPLYTRDTMPVDQTSIYDHRPFECLAPAPSDSDTEEF